MDKHGVTNIEKEFADRNNALFLYDEVGKPIYPPFEYKDMYIFQTYDGVLEIISAEQSKALEIDEIPMEFLKEFSKEIKDELEKKHSGEYDTGPAKRQRTAEETNYQRLHALACHPGNGLNISARG